VSRVVTLFSGADGWGVAARPLGMRPVGIELDEFACATARAAGHLVVRQDVTTFSAARLRGGVRGLIASPPCTDFSTAGRRKGVDGESGRLIFEVPRIVTECEPEWIACEQVPAVLPFWRLFASEFAARGYSVWSGVLDAADYGVPQNRLRAILLASRVRDVSPPRPTHAENPHPVMFGETSLPWVSMAEALGWEATLLTTGQESRLGGGRTERYSRGTERPSPTVTSGAGSGWHLNAHRDQREDGSTQTRTLDRPSPTVTGKAGGGQWFFERPSTTVSTTDRIALPGHHERQWNGAIKVTLEELAALQDFPPGYPFRGNKTQRAVQIGNAIPVGLAYACLGAVL